jgi:hypothetical protein
MKSFSKIAAIALLSLSPGLAGLAHADDTPAPPASTSGSPTPGHHHRHGGPMKRAIKAAFASCKSAGVSGQACAQQLETYLSSFKPNP